MTATQLELEQSFVKKANSFSSLLSSAGDSLKKADPRLLAAGAGALAGGVADYATADEDEDGNKRSPWRGALLGGLLGAGGMHAYQNKDNIMSKMREQFGTGDAAATPESAIPTPEPVTAKPATPPVVMPDINIPDTVDYAPPTRESKAPLAPTTAPTAPNSTADLLAGLATGTNESADLPEVEGALQSLGLAQGADNSDIDFSDKDEAQWAAADLLRTISGDEGESVSPSVITNNANSQEAVRSMPLHLRLAHALSTSDNPAAQAIDGAADVITQTGRYGLPGTAAMVSDAAGTAADAVSKGTGKAVDAVGKGMSDTGFMAKDLAGKGVDAASRPVEAIADLLHGAPIEKLSAPDQWVASKVPNMVEQRMSDLVGADEAVQFREIVNALPPQDRVPLARLSGAELIQGITSAVNKYK